MAPFEYTHLEVEIKFTSTNVTDAQGLVDALLKLKPSIDDQLYEFVINITTFARLTSSIFPPNSTTAAAIADQLPLPWAAARRLSEDECDDAAVLRVTIAFEGVVLGRTIEALQENWPAPLQEWDVEVCGNITFTPTEGSAPEDAGMSVVLLAIISTVVGVAAMSCCAVLAWAVLKARSRRKDNENKYSAMNKRGPPYDVGTFTATQPGARSATHDCSDWTWSSLY